LLQRSVKPEKLVVVGGGPIGCEMAQAHARLGSDVVLIEQDKLLPKDDEEAVQCVRDSLSADGVEVRRLLFGKIGENDSGLRSSLPRNVE